MAHFVAWKADVGCHDLGKDKPSCQAHRIRKKRWATRAFVASGLETK